MIKAKKSLGQNFLNSKRIAQKIASSARPELADTVIEIGPGKGVLTEYLLNRFPKVVAIELDKDLQEHLQEKFAKEIKEGKLELVFADALEVDFHELAKGSYSVVANIPYYITGALLRKIFSEKNMPKEVVLLVQKEVAQRIISDQGSILSNSIKFYGVPRIVFYVPARFFSPQPKVDSAVIQISNISDYNSRLVDESKFFNVLKNGFRSKRKTLANNLAGFASKSDIEKILSELGKTAKARPQELSVHDWIHLANKLYK